MGFERVEAEIWDSGRVGTSILGDFLFSRDGAMWLDFQVMEMYRIGFSKCANKRKTLPLPQTL